jgi:hypothetical protein
LGISFLSTRRLQLLAVSRHVSDHIIDNALDADDGLIGGRCLP